MLKINKLVIIGGMGLLFCIAPVSTIYADEHAGHSPNIQLDMSENAANTVPDHHALAHPFLTHMGLPDGPGESNFRGNYSQSVVDGVGKTDYGFHIEAGLWDGVGLHLRNDAVSGNPSTEVMVQAAIWRDATKLSGVAVFGELEFPTGASSEKKAFWLYGISGRWVMLPYLSFDAVVHHNPSEKMLEWETATVYKLTDNLFPIIEVRGELGEFSPKISVLPALKLKTNPSTMIGVGVQYPVSTNKEYESQLFVQVDMSFH